MNPRTSQDDLETLVEPVCAAHGVELVEVRKLQQKGAWVLQVIIDRMRSDDVVGSGVSLQHCTDVSRDLSRVLDVHEEALPNGPYRLEVGSPGLDRPLTKPSHYQRFLGREVKLQTRVPVSERKRFRGTLKSADDVGVALEVDGQLMRVPFEAIAKANLVPQL